MLVNPRANLALLLDVEYALRLKWWARQGSKIYPGGSGKTIPEASCKSHSSSEVVTCRSAHLVSETFYVSKVMPSRIPGIGWYSQRTSPFKNRLSLRPELVDNAVSGKLAFRNNRRLRSLL
jgi:hypothetical protein